MFNSINLDDKILSSEKFKRDEISFNLIPYLIKNKERYPDIRCYSDGKDCVILNTDINHPVVVWTSSDFSDYESLSCFLYEKFSDNKPLTLTTKHDIYKFFNDKGLVADFDDIRILGVYKCEKLNHIEKRGYIDTAKPEETETIAKMLQSFDNEALPEEQHPFSFYLEKAQSFINCKDTHKVWRDKNTDITSIAYFTPVETNAKIGAVYTVPERRGTSYAKMLVCELSKIILEMNLTPVLYTNFQYEPSNKCYKAIGFELLNTICSYNVKK